MSDGGGSPRLADGRTLCDLDVLVLTPPVSRAEPGDRRQPCRRDRRARPTLLRRRCRGRRTAGRPTPRAAARSRADAGRSPSTPPRACPSRPRRRARRAGRDRAGDAPASASVIDVCTARRCARSCTRSASRRPAAQAAGADGVIAKGHEAGGWVGEEGSFVLSQRLLATAAHARVRPRRRRAAHRRRRVRLRRRRRGARRAAPAGSRVARCPSASERRSPASTAARRRRLGAELGAPFRALSRPGLRGPAAAARRADALEARAERRRARDSWRASSSRRMSPGASRTARCCRSARTPRSPPIWRGGSATSPGSSTACARRSRAPARRSQRANPLAEGAGVAQSHRTRYPLVQGPMTRVSDRAEFAAAVADGGALPFLALALMRGPEADALLARTARAGRRALVGRRRPRLRSRRAARRAAGGRARAPAAVCADRRRTPRSGARARGRRASRPTCMFPRRSCCGCTSATAPAGSCSRAGSAAATWARARASCCGTRCVGVLLDELPDDACDCHVLLRRRHPRRAIGGDGRRDGGGRERARSPDRRADGHRLPVHRGGDRQRSHHAAVSAGGDRGRGHRPARERARPRHPLPAVAVRRAVRGRTAQSARRRSGRRRSCAAAWSS